MAVITSAVMCLALNVYFEARGEAPRGQNAVAHVTLNRARQRNMQVCDVVFQPAQFSWTIEDPKITDERAWAQALDIAKKAYYRRSKDPTAGANHYHATYVSPRWAASMQKTAAIGLHVFYTDRSTQVAQSDSKNKPT